MNLLIQHKTKEKLMGDRKVVKANIHREVSTNSHYYVLSTLISTLRTVSETEMNLDLFVNKYQT